LANIIKVGKKATTVNGGSGNDVITGGKGDDALYGDEDNDKLKGGAGADTLSGGAGNDTLTGGNGKDVFIYDGQGIDVITDYKAGQDAIQINGTINAVTVKGKNVTFNVGDGSLTVKNNKSKKIKLVDSNGNTISEEKYTKSTKAANFVESPVAGSDYDYWFAEDDNFATAEADAVESLVTTTDSAINLTELTVDYTSINEKNKSTYQLTLTTCNKNS
ncbi:MAG: calcium-binding protein, partial [Selenomonadaceae bacterium]|nr:calcium-binding protein [Selenomonadaceae bacterium]